MKTTRRTFLASSLATTAVVSFSSSVPAFLQQASTLANETGEQRVLVVIQLSGGNDGLNTVVPYGADTYYRARPQLAIQAPGSGNGSALQFDAKAGVGPRVDQWRFEYRRVRLPATDGLGNSLGDRPAGNRRT